MSEPNSHPRIDLIKHQKLSVVKLDEPVKTISSGMRHALRTKQIPVSLTDNSPSHSADDVQTTEYEEKCFVNFASTASALYIPGKVECYTVQHLVDSGCTLNLLSKRVYDKLPKKFAGGIQPFNHSNGMLADGSGLQFYGQIQLAVRLRSETAELEFVIAEIEPDVILGMPFLQSYNCKLEFAKTTLVMNGKHLRCTNRNGVDFVSKIQVINNITIPPRSEKIIQCRLLNNICSSTGVIESTGAAVHHGIALAASVCTWDKKREMLVRCINPVNQICHVTSGSVIGICTGVDSAQIVDCLQANGVECENQCQSAGFINAPTHLANNYEEATTTCTDLNQRQSIAKLLTEFADVFSTGDDDQGLTDLFKHSIPVRPDARPIKQAPRRLGVEKEAEVSRQVTKLEKQGIIEPGHGVLQ